MGDGQKIADVHNNDMISGSDLKSLRKELGESQAIFGSRFGVHQSTIARWESRGIPTDGTAPFAVNRIFTDTRDASVNQQNIEK